MSNSAELNKKTFIITGGNSGLGFTCAKNIAKADNRNHVILACRNRSKAEEAVESLISQTGNTNITYMLLDLASLESIRNFATTFSEANYPPLYALICNAGLIMVDKLHYTKDGFELSFGVNHLGHFLLTNLLLNELSDSGRIVFVSSGTHDPENKTIVSPPVYENAKLLAYPTEKNSKESALTGGQRRYSTSKLCNIYCVYELAEKIDQHTNKTITVNAFDPGEMPGTGFSRSFPAPLRVITKYLNYISALFKSNTNTPNQSGQALAELVLNPEYSNTTGKYFEGRKEKKSSKLSYDVKNRRDLWTTSVELTKLKQEETVIDLN